MKIKLPTQCRDLNLNDREKIFAWLIYEAAIKLKTKDWYKYEFNFHSRDINHILGKPAANPAFKNLRKVFNIGVLNEWTVSVNWIKPRFAGNRHQFPDSYEDTLKDPELFVMYAYLLGRCVSKETLFADESHLLYEKWHRPANGQIEYLYSSYRKMQ